MSTTLELDAAVALLIGADDVRAEQVRRDPVAYDAFMAAREITRISGVAEVGGQSIEWSFIEKRTEGPATASAYLYDNGRREMAAYRSGLLENLAPGVTAPRLLASDEDRDGGLTIWMEDVATTARNPTSRDEILLAARHLGRLSGRWLGRIPGYPWLFGGWIDRHRQPEAIAGGMAIVEAARGDPRIEALVDGRLDELAGLIGSQGAYAAALGGLPHTLCHHDAVAANVFRRQTDDGFETVLIDWESVGPGPIGADLASLLFASPRRGDFSARLLDGLFPDALAAYAAGMADVDAAVEADDLRLGVHASIALRWALGRDVVRVLAEGGTARRGSAPNEPADQAMAELVALVPVLLDSAADARRIMRAG